MCSNVKELCSIAQKDGRWVWGRLYITLPTQKIFWWKTKKYIKFSSVVNYGCLWSKVSKRNLKGKGLTIQRCSTELKEWKIYDIVVMHVLYVNTCSYNASGKHIVSNRIEKETVENTVKLVFKRSFVHSN